ncbi:hypothetical protein OGR47_08600 [Methylocystis sp. MJC1]|uniref:hypothetical protein n=1 Tax=Methylocystis sp. MJC1 TaxID=2654282 RepID=UPI0013EC1DF4|nr:hypothetical protein [Methylocystis sp. MJC1]KAF2991716.1 hypothetical protein MJC1_01281 [Methylocystis sp. MJC1]MBU6527045.1 hypothetical protein [Methylocystis sp. MJC1]UZX13482.1 hypothetical protein OGR47_08600 [Methylocystis sp. MJC1]
MSFTQEEDIRRRSAPQEIAAEASSEFSRTPSFDELWGRPMRPVARQAPEVKRDRAPIVAAIIAIIIGATAMIAMRERIVRIAPPLATTYRALGMPVNLAGLELRDVRSRIVMDGARRVLVTEGEIVNIRRDRNAVPAISLAVRGTNGLDRYRWTAPAPKSRLDAGEKIAFRARLASPPEDGAEVLVRFAKLDAEKGQAPTYR